METQATNTPAAAPVATTQQRSYLAMVLLAFFVGPTGLARAYIGDKVGMIRFYIWIAAFVITWTFVQGLQVTAGLAMLVLTVWGIVDFFLLYKQQEDTNGVALATSKRDQKFAKVFFVLYIIGICLVVIAFILGLIFGAAAISNLQHLSN